MPANAAELPPPAGALRPPYPIYAAPPPDIHSSYDPYCAWSGANLLSRPTSWRDLSLYPDHARDKGHSTHRRFFCIDYLVGPPFFGSRRLSDNPAARSNGEVHEHAVPICCIRPLFHDIQLLFQCLLEMAHMMYG